MEEQLIKKILPHSAEAEQSVIGAMIMDQEAILTASEILTSDDFYNPQFRTLRCYAGVVSGRKTGGSGYPSESSSGDECAGGTLQCRIYQ